MPEPDSADGLIMTATRAFYEGWAASAQATEGHPRPPEWDALTYEQVSAWMLAFASTIEAAARMAVAVTATLAG